MLRYRRGAEPRKDTDTHAATQTQPVIKQPTAAPLAECAAPDGQNRAPGSLVFGLAIKVCIRTGARYGCEFAKLTARHVEISERGMIWRFSANESKTRKTRLIYVRDSEIIALVQQLMKRYPAGPLFRNESGEPFDQHALSSQFTRLKKRLASKGIILDAECCMYSCRHTYAKRVLNGYWTGRVTTIEHLAKLMGNTPDVCRKYADWCEGYTAPLWEAV